MDFQLKLSNKYPFTSFRTPCNRKQQPHTSTSIPVFKQICTYIHSWHDPKKTENLGDHSLPAYLETQHHHARLYPPLSAYGLVDHFGLCRNRRARYVNTLKTTINSKSAAIFSPTVLETFSFSSTSLPWMMVPLFLQPAYDESSGAQLNKAGKREETDIVKIETI